MAMGETKLYAVLDQAGGPTEQGLRNLLLGSELASWAQDESAWAEICEFVLKVDRDHEISSAYNSYLDSSNQLKSVIEDNYILAAVAAIRHGMHKRDPLIAWAASNKSEFAGFRDGLSVECATMRLLQWAGADVSMPASPSGMTALHYMVSVKHTRGSDPRIVKWLLQCGADANSINKNGDTPMGYLCGISIWGAAQSETFRLLLDAGCDPLARSNDGATAIDLLRQVEAMAPLPARNALIIALERDVARAKPGFFTRMVGATPSVVWKEALSVWENAG